VRVAVKRNKEDEGSSAKLKEEEGGGLLRLWPVPLSMLAFSFLSPDNRVCFNALQHPAAIIQIFPFRQRGIDCKIEAATAPCHPRVEEESGPILTM
jgi:hypothetical protein